MIVAALTAFASFVLVALVYADPPDVGSRAAATLRFDLSRREWVLVSLAGLIWATYNVGYIVLVSFLPEWFVTRGFALAEASGLVSLLGWVLIPTVPLAGYMAERVGRPDLMTIGGLSAVAIAAAAMPSVHNPVAVFVVIAIAVGIPAGLIMALPAQVLRPQNRAAGMGVYFAWYYAAMAFLPAMAGAARDVSGDADATALFAAAMMAVAIAVLAMFRLTQGRVAALA